MVNDVRSLDDEKDEYTDKDDDKSKSNCERWKRTRARARTRRVEDTKTKINKQR